MHKAWVRILTTGITLAMMVLIFFFSTEPAEESDVTSGVIATRVADTIRPGWQEMERTKRERFYKDVQFAVHKVAHYTEFALLGASLLLCLISGFGWKRFFWLVAWVGGTAYAALDELHQLLVDGRSGQARDVLIDSLGVISGILITLLILRKWGRQVTNQ